MPLKIANGPLRLGGRGGLQIKGGSTAFNPTLYGTVAGWWKADGFSQSDASNVTTWPDSSTNARDAITVSGTAPTYRLNVVNGKPVVRFGGAGHISTAAFAHTAQWTVFAVAKATAASGTQGICNADSGSGAGRIAQFLRYNGSNLEAQAFNTGPTGFADPEPASPTSFQVLEGIHDATTVEAFVNGTGAASTSTTGTPASGSTVFGLGDAVIGVARLTGDIAEVIYYSGALTSQNRSTVRAYLGTKYGITVS